VNDFILRPMTSADIDSVNALEARIYKIDPWSKEQIESEVAGIPLTRHYVVAEGGSQIVGYGGLFSPSTGVDADIQTVTVAPEWQGKGIGRTILVELLGEAARRCAPAVLLEVRLGNAAAIHLYESFGFVEIARRRNYYGQDIHALVMRKVLLGVEETS
jgi:ribosomal-protein-alanine N-acetyltransferase